jgi:hypothetical protein
MEITASNIITDTTISLSDFISHHDYRIKRDLEKMGLIEAMKSGANEKNIRKFFESHGIYRFGFLYPESSISELFWEGRFWKRAVVGAHNSSTGWMIRIAGWKKMVDIVYGGLEKKEIIIIRTLREDNGEVF